MKCFYHGTDFDGFCSAAIVAMKHEGIECIPVSYGDKCPIDTIQEGELVYIVDFSFEPDEMKALNLRKAELVWIDHHDTALKKMKGFVPSGGGFQEVGKAGCELTWHWLYPEIEMPTVVRLLGRYDVWDWPNVAGALEFQYSMKLRRGLFKPNMDNWLNNWKYMFSLAMVDLEPFIYEGSVIVDHEAVRSKEYIEHYGFMTTIDGYECFAVNAGHINSATFNSLEKKPPVLLAFVYYEGQWNVSLRSDDPTVHVGDIAARRGGGGHRGASGFGSKDLSFLGSNLKDEVKDIIDEFNKAGLCGSDGW